MSLEASVSASNSWNLKKKQSYNQQWKFQLKTNFKKALKFKYLKGICMVFVAREDITSPSAKSDLLMFCASCNLSPCTHVFATRSVAELHFATGVCRPQRFLKKSMESYCIYHYDPNPFMHKTPVIPWSGFAPVPAHFRRHQLAIICSLCILHGSIFLLWPL